MGSGVSSMGFHNKAKRVSSEVQTGCGREDENLTSSTRFQVSSEKFPKISSPLQPVCAANDEDLEEKVRLMDRDPDLLLDDDEILGNIDGYSDIDGNKVFNESGASSSGSSDGHQNNRESWNMLKHSLEVDDEEMMLNLLFW